MLLMQGMDMPQWRERRAQPQGGHPGEVRQEVLLAAQLWQALALFLCYHNSNWVSPGPLYTVSPVRDERLRSVPYGLGPTLSTER